MLKKNAANPVYSTRQHWKYISTVHFKNINSNKETKLFKLLKMQKYAKSISKTANLATMYVFSGNLATGYASVV